MASASALVGAIILGYPIVLTALKDLRRGVLSINELVAIAVLAAFASGDYKTAGVVAFFMLMGEIIETRTAEGARASIESLIKLTPTKARRITPQGEEEVGGVLQFRFGAGGFYAPGGCRPLCRRRTGMTFPAEPRRRASFLLATGTWP